jgi:hypothetical protein
MDELKNLYRLGFPEDSEGDVEYFFGEKIKDAEIFFYSEGGKILSAAYIFKRKLRIFENIPFEGADERNLKACGEFSDAPPLAPHHGGECRAEVAAFEGADERNLKACGRFSDAPPLHPSHGGECCAEVAAFEGADERNLKTCGRFSDAPPLHPSHGGECCTEVAAFEGAVKAIKTFKDVEIPFLAAAATLPELRGKKIFHNVMREIFSRYKDEPFIALYPFKHEYYNKNFGFENFNYLPVSEENFKDFHFGNGGSSEGIYYFFVDVSNFRGENCGKREEITGFQGKDCGENKEVSKSVNENYKKSEKIAGFQGENCGKSEEISNFQGENCGGNKEVLKSVGKRRLSEILTEIYSSYAENFDAYIVRDAEYFEKKIAEWRAGNGKIGLIYTEKQGGEKAGVDHSERCGEGEIGLIYTEKQGGEKAVIDYSERCGDGKIGLIYKEKQGGEKEGVDHSERCGEREIGLIYTKKFEKIENGAGRGKEKPVGYVFFRTDGAVEERCFVDLCVEEKFCGKNPTLKPAMMIKILNEKKAAELFSRAFSDLKTFSLEKY